MVLKKYAWWSVQALVVIAVVTLLVGQLLGQPILFSYVTTGSMEPTLEPGDGFVALPPEIAGTPSEGDVIAFEAQEIQGGGLTTHRIVEETERGYITAGDANPFTDQDGSEPLVQEPEVLAVAWQPGDEVLVIPHLGTVAGGLQSAIEVVQRSLAQLLGTDSLLGIQGIAYLLFATSIVLYVVDLKLSSGERKRRVRSRSTGTSTRRIVLALTALLLAGVTAAMVAPAGSHEFGVVSAEFESDSPNVVEAGTTESYQYEIGNQGVVPTVVVLEPGGDNIDAGPETLRLGGREAANTTVNLTAPPETGTYRSLLEERRYLGLLPTGVILTLHDIHPWLPTVAINAVVGVPFYLLGMYVLGTGRARFLQRDSPSKFDRLVSRLT